MSQDLNQPVVKKGQEFQVNTYTDNHQFQPSVSNLENGNFVVTWTYFDQDGSNGLFGQLFNSEGNKISDEFQVYPDTFGYQYSSSATALENGNFVVTWNNIQNNDNDGVLGQVFNSQGNKIGNAFQLDAFVHYSQDAPSVSGLDNGNFVVTWTSLEQDTGHMNISGQIFSSQGNKIGNEFQIDSFNNDYLVTEIGTPSVSGLDNGNFVVTWLFPDHCEQQNNYSPGDSLGVYGQIFNSQGNKIGDQFQVNENPLLGFPFSFSRKYTVVSHLENGNFVVIFNNAQYLEEQPYGQIFNSQGDKIGGNFAVNNISVASNAVADHKGDISVSGLENGNFVVTWHGYSPEDNNGVFAQLFNPQGDKIGNEFLVNTYTNDAEQAPSVIGLENGNFVIVWYHDDDGNNGAVAVYGQIFHDETTTATIKPNYSTVKFEKTAYLVVESEGNVEVTLTRSLDNNEIITVNYETVDNTAKANIDYTPISGTIAFDSDETSKTITIPINDNDLIQWGQNFSLILTTSADSNAILGNNEAVIHIVDDDEYSIPISVELVRLTNVKNQLNSLLEGLELFGDEQLINQLKNNFTSAFQEFLPKYENLLKDVYIKESKVNILETKIQLAQQDQAVKKERLQDLLIEKDGLSQKIKIWQDQKQQIKDYNLPTQETLNAKIAEIEGDITSTEQQLADVRLQIKNSNSETKKRELNLQVATLKSQLYLHIANLDAHKTLLDLVGLDITLQLERIDLKINHETEDLDVLNYSKIPAQENLVNTANTKLLTLETELNQLKPELEEAKILFTEFESQNSYLLTNDASDFADWNINENTSESSKLYQQVLTVEGLEIIDDRLTSITSQGDSEHFVEEAIQIDNIDGYVNLDSQLSSEIDNLFDIWSKNLEQSNNYTTKTFELSQELNLAVDDVITYVEDNLADPYEEYVLDKINFSQAIALEEALVKYQDSLAKSVDGLEESIEVLKNQQNQYELVSARLDHISTLRSLEQQYSLNQNVSNIAPNLIEELNEEIDNKTQYLVIDIDLTDDQLEQSIESSLQNYIQTRRNQIPNITTASDVNGKIDIISDLQNLQVQITYFIQQAEANPSKLQQFLGAYQNSNKSETTVNNLLNQYYPDLSDATTIDTLKQQINTELTNSQTEFQNLQAKISQQQANASALLSQAQWYQVEAQKNWNLSKKQGPTWTEYRKAKGKSGRSKTVTITHVDHYWLTWDNYTKQAKILQGQVINLNKQIANNTYQQELTADLISQWEQAKAIADEAELTFEQFQTRLEQIEAGLEIDPKTIGEFESILTTLEQQLPTAQQKVEETKANTITAQNEFDSSNETYKTALMDVLAETSELEANSYNLLQQIANSRAWVTQQMISLDVEMDENNALITSLKGEIAEIKAQNNEDSLSIEDKAKIAQIQLNIDTLAYKQTVLTAEKTVFTQKQTLLDAQENTILAEKELLVATLLYPDDDHSLLESLLTDAQASLAEAQIIAEDAEANSKIISGLLEKLQAFIELQNDTFLDEIKAKLETLQTLIDTIELKENYTSQVLDKQLELNANKQDIINLLETLNGYSELNLQFLLDAVEYGNFATASELYYKDYRDLMTDNGGSCSGGIARPEDATKAQFYYNEMQKYRELQEDAQAQADQFAELTEATEAQIQELEIQQATLQQEYDEILAQIKEAGENIEELEKQLNIAEIRLDALEYIKDVTQQVQLQLFEVEQKNLALAQLEQKFAQQYQNEINDAIRADFQRQQREINRGRAISTAKIKHLNQLKAEDALQQTLNELRERSGLAPIDIIQFAEYKGQLAGLLADLETFQQQKPDLSPEIKTLLEETMADIADALLGDEAQTIQENLLRTANALNEEAKKLQLEINKLNAEEINLLNILNQSETDLQTATKNLYDEIQQARELGEEYQEVTQEQLETLYSIGYAEGAVDLSSQLAQQSKDILEQIIDARIEERKARKKASFLGIFGTVTLVISAVSAVFTAGASLGLTSVLGTSVSTITTTLNTINFAIQATQAAYNGDWSGAIFKAGMAVLGAAQLGGATVPNLGLGFDHIKNFGQVQQIASGVYNGYQAFEAGDGITGFLNLIGASFNIGLPEYSYLAQAGLSIHSGVQLAEEDNWLGAVSSFLSATFALGSGLRNEDGSSVLSTQLLDVISTAEIGTNIISAIDNISDDDSLEGWLNGITLISNSLTNYVKEQQTVDILTNFKKLLESEKIIKKPDLNDRLNDTKIQALIEKYGEDNVFIVYLKDNSTGKLIKQPQPYITKDFDLNENNKGGLMIRGDFDENKPTFLVTHGWISGISAEWSIEIGELLAKLYPNHNIIIGDWSELSKDINYFSAASNTQLVGQKFADQLHNLGVDFNQLQIIAHSLGAHVAGTISEYAQSKEYGEVKKIVGLDPANPGFESSLFLFENESNEGRLDASDAKDVILIRSDYDWIFSLGYRNPRGSQDIKLTSEMLENYPGIDHTDATKFLIESLDRGYSLDNIDQFFAIKNQELLSQTNQPKPSQGNTQSLYNIKTILNQDDETINYNNPLPSFIESSNSSFGSYNADSNQIIPLDPVVIDLDGNGLELSDLEISNIFFDIDADGYAENVSWTTDGILTVDLNNDGTINNITEIFSEYFNDGSANSGLEALIAYDSNGNGIISDNDTQYNQILVWQDLNQNGISEPEELKTLAEHGITSINLNGINDELVQDGNIIKKRSFFNRADGTGGEISDIAFLVTKTGFQINQTATGTQIIAEDDSAISLLIHEKETPLTLNLANAGVQVAIGNNGNDYLFTTNNQDIFISGEAGNDTLEGGGGNDWLLGGEGEDTLSGGNGADILTGGDGNDTFIYNDIAESTADNPDTITDFEVGSDVIDIFALSLNFSDLTISISEGKTIVTSNINNFGLDLEGELALTSADFILNNSTVNNPPTINSSNFEIAENQSEVGTIQATDIDGDTLTYNITGGADGNLFQINSNTGLLSFINAPDYENSLDANTDNIYQVEITVKDSTIDSQPANISVTVTDVVEVNEIYGTEGRDQLDGTDADDIIYGLGDNDRLQGKGGNDTIEGGAGNDILYGNAGADVLSGGAGNDRYYIDAQDTIIESSGKNDIIYTSSDADLANYSGIEHITLLGQGDRNATGDDNINKLTGNNGDNVLTGKGGTDTIKGKNGNDTLVGGEGNDVLAGGSGFDSFQFNNPNEGTDRITDFNVLEDRILINGANFSPDLVAGSTITPEQFVYGTSATTSEHRFIYYASQGILGFDADGVGGNPLIQIAKLTNAPTDFSEDNIVVI